MIGKNQITIDAQDFIKGASTSAYISDGGFSPSTGGVNLTKSVGVLYPPPVGVDSSTNLTDSIIASCEDPTYLGKQRMFLDDTGAFYQLDGSNVLTKKVTTSSDLFTFGTTDFIPWSNTANGTNWYATTKAGASGDIVKWNGNVTLTETWWSGAGTLNQGSLSNATAWRPLLNYETFLYVGDANKLHRVDIALTVSNGILTLSAEETISALAIDPSSGKMLVAATTGVDFSAQRNGKSTIYMYDGYSNKAIKACSVNGTITSMKVRGGIVYVFYGNKIGYFTGTGIQFLRKLQVSRGTGGLLVYPHHATTIENTLYYVDNGLVWAYGEVMAGRPVFNPVLTPSGAPTCIANIGGDTLGVAYPTNKFFTYDMSTSAGTTLFLETNTYRFPRPVYIRQVYLEYADSTAASATTGTLIMFDETSNSTNFTAGDSANVISNPTSSAKRTFITNDVSKKVNACYFRYSISETDNGLIRMVIYYDVAE